MAGKVVIRRRVPKDNNCLFSAVGYLCEGRQGSVCTELRAEVAEFVKSSADMSEVMLGMDVEEYGRWIRNEFNWGGETEILCLSKKYQVELQVVLMGPKSTSLTYNEGGGTKGRVYLLYTGQHYDAIVSAPSPDALPDSETRVHTSDFADLDKMVLALGDYEFQEDAKKASIRVKKLLKCGGCGHLCNDTAAFQEHCGEVDHDDDFMYECSEVEVEVEEEANPDASQLLDLYNTSDQILATLHASPFPMNQKDFPTLEHCLQFQRYEGDADTQTKIMQAGTGEEAYRVGEFGGGGREDWEGVRDGVLEQSLRAKLQGVPQAKAALLATGPLPFFLSFSSFLLFFFFPLFPLFSSFFFFFFFLLLSLLFLVLLSCFFGSLMLYAIGTDIWHGPRLVACGATRRVVLTERVFVPGEREIRVVGADNWLGVTIASGNVQVTGKNCLGKTLVKLREELKGE